LEWELASEKEWARVKETETERAMEMGKGKEKGKELESV